jgi:acyl-CoA thioesterase
MNYLEKIKQEGRDANPFFRLMDIEIGDICEGNAEISMKIRPDMMNGEDWLQGGLFTALADEAMVLAIYSLLAANEQIATISETTTFISGAREGENLVASGRVIKKGKRVVFAEGDVRSIEEGKGILSRSSAAFAVLKQR